MKTRLEEHYHKNIHPSMVEKFNYKNKFEVPKLTKVVINIGVGEAVKDSKKIDSAIKEITAISGQKPVITRAKKAIATFKLREGMPIGVKVTLRKSHMYEFIDRLINIALPRVKDFRGLNPKGIDASYNYSFGVKEHIIFPEVNFDKVDKIRGLDVTIVTTSKTEEGTLELLKEFNFPLNSKKN